jgi:ribosomal protein S6--L-glutamate ligase
MKRKAGKGERRANVGIGGKPKKKKLSAEMEELAVRTAKTLGLGIAGVDIIESDKGPMVIEANVNVLFRGLVEVTRTNVAEHIIEYMKEEAEIATKGHVVGSFFKVIDRLKFK